jgi:hypothetical protein
MLKYVEKEKMRRKMDIEIEVEIPPASQSSRRKAFLHLIYAGWLIRSSWHTA